MKTIQEIIVNTVVEQGCANIITIFLANTAATSVGTSVSGAFDEIHKNTGTLSVPTGKCMLPWYCLYTVCILAVFHYLFYYYLE